MFNFQCMLLICVIFMLISHQSSKNVSNKHFNPSKGILLDQSRMNKTGTPSYVFVCFCMSQQHVDETVAHSTNKNLFKQTECFLFKQNAVLPTCINV